MLTRLCQLCMSMQGNCSGPVPFDVSLGRDLKPGQCLVALRHSLLRLKPVGQQSVWMDNLYLFTDRDDGGALIANDSPQHSVWMTNIVCEGTRQNSTAFVLGGEQSKFYIGGASLVQAARAACESTCLKNDVCRLQLARLSRVPEQQCGRERGSLPDARLADSAVLNNKAAIPGILLFGGEAGNSVALRLRRVEFEGNAGTMLGSASVVVFQLALAAVENCTFSDDPTVLNILALNGTCGADDPTAYMASALSGGTFGPLSVLPSNLTFLTDEDADLLDIQQVRFWADPGQATRNTVCVSASCRCAGRIQVA